MPRPNGNREVYAEEHLARRIASERDRRGWTYEGLAARMTQVGCQINPSALYKIEKGRPPRRISVDEAVALSRVFSVPIQELLCDPLLVETRVPALIEQLRAIGRQKAEARIEWDERSRAIKSELDGLVARGTPEARAQVLGYLERLTSSTELAMDIADDLFEGTTEP